MSDCEGGTKDRNNRIQTRPVKKGNSTDRKEREKRERDGIETNDEMVVAGEVERSGLWWRYCRSRIGKG